jgi:thiamine biosynthesis protein ThiS
LLVTINGAADHIADVSSVKDVLVARSIPLEVAIVALNGEIVKREDWQSTMLALNDDLEIIRIIGGG